MATPKKNTVKETKSVSNDNVDSELLQREYFRNLSLNFFDECFLRIRNLFLRLASNPPQTLLIEGGTSLERIGAALFFAALLNCEADEETQKAQQNMLLEVSSSQQLKEKPCFKCESCQLFMCAEHRDLILLDGRSESIKIDIVREMQNSLASPPSNAKKRVVILAEAHNLVDMAGQALLKTLEEPKTHTIFILCTSQRERLLPTLVSRSWVVTLPWKKPHYILNNNTLSLDDTNKARTVLQDSLENDSSEQIKTLEQALINLVDSDSTYAKLNAQSWMSLSSQKGYLDKELGLAFLTHCRRELCMTLGLEQAVLNETMSFNNADGLKKDNNVHLSSLSLLASFFSTLDKSLLLNLGYLLDQAESDLTYGLNPSLVLDCFVTRLFLANRN